MGPQVSLCGKNYALLQTNLNEMSDAYRYVHYQRCPEINGLVINGWGISSEIALIWMSLDFTDDQSTLV